MSVSSFRLRGSRVVYIIISKFIHGSESRHARGEQQLPEVSKGR